MRMIQGGKMTITIQAEKIEDDELPNPGIVLEYPVRLPEESSSAGEQEVVQHTLGVVSDVPQ